MEKNKLLTYLLPGIGMVCFLAAALFLLRTPNRTRLTDTASTARPVPTSTDSVPVAVPATAIPTRHSAPTDTPSAAFQVNVPVTQYPTIPPSAPAFTAAIHSTDPSGISGTATFKEISGSVAILLHLDGLPADEESIMPVELRFGTCIAPGALAYPMTAPDAGESETDLSIDLKQFDAQKPMAVVLYRSLQDRTVIACGDIP